MALCADANLPKFSYMKLQKTLLSALLLAAPLALSAESIDAQQALALAAQQLESTPEALTLVHTATDPVSGEPTFYAFNREGGGFALVAADDRVDHVVLAYNYYGAYNHSDLSGDLPGAVEKAVEASCIPTAWGL